jgi:hypothetical protein
MSGSIGEPGPLTQVVHSYERVMRELAPRVRAPSDWAPLAELVAVDDFERIGTFLETQNWEQYTVMLTRWASSIDSFETSVRRISELPSLVYYELEERHHHGDVVNVVNSLSVFAFDGRARIRHLDVYLQQPQS